MMIDTRGPVADGGDESEPMSDRIPPPKIQVVRRSTYEKMRKAGRETPTSERGIDLDQDESKTRPEIVKSADGNFYQMQIFMEDDEKLFLTIVDRITKQKVYNKALIPEAFTQSVPNEDFDILDAVKKALVNNIKTTSSLKDGSGSLNPSIFANDPQN